MSGYAVRNDRRGWRSVSSPDEVMEGEFFSPVVVDIEPTYQQELQELNEVYSADRLKLCQAWLVAAVADGTGEAERKTDVEEELAELDAQHFSDVTELKGKYGVE